MSFLPFRYLFGTRSLFQTPTKYGEANHRAILAELTEFWLTISCSLRSLRQFPTCAHGMHLILGYGLWSYKQQ